MGLVCRAGGRALRTRSHGLPSLADLAAVDRLVHNRHRVLLLLRRPP